MRTMTRETCQILKISIKNLLIFEMIYRLLAGPIFLQLLNYGVKFSLRMAGYSYLTPGNLGSFLIRPWTVLMILLISIIAMLFLMIEAGGFITAYSGAAYSVSVNPGDILIGGFKNLKDELARKNVKLAGIVLIDYILINGFIFGRIMAHVRPVSFVMKSLWEEPLLRLLFILVVLILFAIAIPATLAIHGCMIEQKSFSDSMNRSQVLLKGHWIKAVFSLVAGQAALILGLIVFYIICVFLAAVAVVLLVDKNMEYAFLMEAGNRIEWVLLVVGSMLAGILYFAQTTVLYYRCGGSGSSGWDFAYTAGKAKVRRPVLIVLCTIGLASGICLFDTAYNGNFIAKSISAEIEITAHRGSSNTAPENTMAAIEAAVEELADRAEIDVQESADGQVVLFHDNTLKRITGSSQKVADLTYEQLKELDVGSWFSQEYAGEQIPTLEQVMEYSKGRIDLNIEIKNRGNDSQLPEKVLTLIYEYEMQEQCVVTSTNLNYLRRIKELEPEIKTGYILSAAYGNYYSDEAVDFISIRSNFVTENLVENCHKAGRTIHAWTVNSTSELERLKMMGVDSVITDFPVLARETIYEETAAKTLLEYLELMLK